MKSHTFGCSFALAILMAYSIMAMLDAPSDIEAAQATATDLQTAINSEAAGARFARAAAQICGENAGYKELGDSSMQCYTKRGAKTIKVAL